MANKNLKIAKLSVLTNQQIKNSQSSLFSLLSHFDLHQYYNQLKALGFTDSNPQIQLLEIKNRRKFTNELNLMPGHNNKFLRMLSKLEKMLPREGLFQSKQTFTERSIDNSENFNINSRKVRNNYFIKTLNSIYCYCWSKCKFSAKYARPLPRKIHWRIEANLQCT